MHLIRYKAIKTVTGYADQWLLFYLTESKEEKERRKNA